jgi:hypothetical protein
MDGITLNEAVNRRRASMVPAKLYIVTDVGEFEAPQDIAALFDAARPRKDGRPDGRTKAGKKLRKFEREFCAKKLQEWAAN